MKRILCMFFLVGGTVNAQESPYNRGLNGNGSYYSRGSSNYSSGVNINGNSFNRVYIPSINQYGNFNYLGNNWGYVPSTNYWWRDRLHIPNKRKK